MKKSVIWFTILLIMVLTLPVHAEAATGEKMVPTQDVEATEQAEKHVAVFTGSSHHGHAFKEIFSTKLQTLLKLDEDALRSQLKAGKTLAQIAESQGVSRADLKATLIAANNEALERNKAKFIAHVDRIMDSTLQDYGRHKRHMKLDFTETAKLLGMNKADLKSELKKGATLAELAKLKGVEVQKVIDLLASQMMTRTDQALKDGKITQAEYNERKNKISNMATKIVNGQFRSDHMPSKAS